MNARRLAYLLLGLVLCIALWVRGPRISEGLPFFYGEDEAHHFNRIVEMVKSGDLNPNYYLKPSLHFYLRIPVVAASFLWNVREGHIRSVKDIKTRDPYGLANYSFTASHSGIVKWNRAFSVLLSLAAVVLTFLVGRMLFHDDAVALGGAALVALSAGHAEYSATIGVDVVMSFFVLACVAAALWTQSHFTLARLFLCATLCGLAMSSKYNALPLLVVPILSVALAKRRDVAAWSIALLVPWAAFLVASPFIIVSLPLFLDHLAYEVWHYQIAGHVGHQAEPGIQQLIFYSRWLADQGVGLAGFCGALIGIAGAFVLLRRRALIALAFPLLFLALMITQRANFERNMLVLIPFFAVCAAYTMRQVSFITPRFSTPVFCALLVIVLVQPALRSFEARTALTERPESRFEAGEWLASAERVETAVGGQLQFPAAVASLPDTSIIDQKSTSPLALYLDGYDRLLVSRAYPKQWKEQFGQFFNEERKFPGDPSEQRIVKNPEVVVALARDEESAFASLDLHALPRLFCGAASGPSSGEYRCPSDDPESTEHYSWINHRLTLFTFSPLPSEAEEHTYEMKLEVMTPWEQQTVSLLLPGNLTRQDLSVQPGQWTSVRFQIPGSQLSQGIIVGIDEVHTPKSRGGKDPRRLGVALKNIVLSAVPR